jgi:integrase
VRRQGEILALRWEDVDLVKGQLSVRRSVTREIITTPKSGKSRDIPLGDEVLDHGGRLGNRWAKTEKPYLTS